MNLSLLASSPAVLAAPGDTSGLTSWLSKNVVGLVILVIGIAVLARAHNRDHKAALGTVSIMLIGLAVLGLSTGDHASQVGSWLGHLVFGT